MNNDWRYLFISVAFVGILTASAAQQTPPLFAVDGDSIDATGGEQFRLICIDAPEYDQPGGTASKKLLAKFVRQGVTFRRVRQDKHGRTLALFDFRHNGDSVNLAMIQAGHAWVYGGPLADCEIPKKTLCAAEKKARQKKRGLWRKDNPVSPYVWRNKGRRFLSKRALTSACER